MKKMFMFLLIVLMPTFLRCDVTTEYAYSRAIKDARQQKWTEAQDVLQRLLVDDPTSAQLLYDNGVAAFHTKDFEHARAYFKDVLSTDAPEALKEQASYNAGNCAVELQALQDAVDMYEKTLKINPENTYAKHNLEVVKQMMEQQQEQQNQDSSSDNKENSDKQESSEQNNKDQPSSQNNSDDQQNPSSDQSQEQQNQSSDHKPQDQNQNSSDRQDQQENDFSDSKQQDDTCSGNNQQEGDNGQSDQQDGEQNAESMDGSDSQSGENTHEDEDGLPQDESPHKSEHENQKSNEENNEKQGECEQDAQNDAEELNEDQQSDNVSNKDHDSPSLSEHESDNHAGWSQNKKSQDQMQESLPQEVVNAEYMEDVQEEDDEFAPEDAWIAQMLDECDEVDNKTNRRIMKATIDSGLAGEYGQKCW